MGQCSESGKRSSCVTSRLDGRGRTLSCIMYHVRCIVYPIRYRMKACRRSRLALVAQVLASMHRNRYLLHNASAMIKVAQHTMRVGVGKMRCLSNSFPTVWPTTEGPVIQAMAIFLVKTFVHNVLGSLFAKTITHRFADAMRLKTSGPNHLGLSQTRLEVTRIL